VDTGAAFTGGAGNDSFTATGATLTVNDTLVGGAGTDTLTIADLTGGLAAGVPTGASITGFESAVVTTSSSIGANATAASTPVTTAVAQVNSLVYTKTATTGITLTIGGAEYKSGTLTEDATGANAAAAAVTLINAAIGGTQAAASTGTVTITGAIAGKSLPSISGSTVTTAAKPLQNSPVAVKEVATFAITNAASAAVTVYIDGVKYTAVSGADATATGATVAGIINSVLGTGVAVNSTGTLTVTAPVAGVGLPIITVAVAGGSVATTNPIPNQAAVLPAVAAVPYAISGWTDLTSFDGTATTAANVSAAKTTDLKLSGTTVVTSSGKDVTITASDSVYAASAVGAVKITAATTSTSLVGAVASDSGSTAGDAAGVYVTGGTTVNITGTKGTTDVKVGAAPYAKNAVSTASNFPQTNGNSSKTPTGDVSVTKVSLSTSTSTGAKTGTYGIGANSIYTNGATSVTSTGSDSTTITDAGTLSLQSAADVASAPGTSKLATVTLAGLSGGATIKSDAITTVNLSDTLTTQTVTISNSGALNANTGAINFNVSNAGVSAGRVILSDATHTSVNVGTLAASAYNSVGTGTATAVSSNSSSKSWIQLNTPAATSVTMTNALAVDIGNVTTNAPKVATINASGATGAVTTTIGSATTVGMSFTGGSGADSVSLTGDPSVTATTKATSVALGAGNDSLLNSTSSAVSSTSFTGASFDGGDGNDTVAISLLTAGNAPKFTNFETLGLDIAGASAVTRDLSILNGITGYKLIENGTSTVTYQNAEVAKGLTISGAAAAGVTNATGVTLLDFGTTVAGTADAYTITFAGSGSSTSTAASPSTIQSGVVTIAGIEAVSLVSGGTNSTNNTIKLNDADARTLTITGAQKATVSFDTAFGTAGAVTTAVGVSSIDASAMTGILSLNTTNVATAYAGISVKGGSSDDSITLAAQSAGNGVYTVDAGAGSDTITTALASSTLTGGAGKDTFVVTGSTAGTTGYTSSTNVTTITDLTAGDKVTLKAAASSPVVAFNTTKVDVSGAITLAAALDLASATSFGSNTNVVSWFQYGPNTYVVGDNTSGTSTFATGDIVVKLSGLIDLSSSTIASTTAVLTIA